MTRDELFKLHNELREDGLTTLSSKASEYAQTGDVLSYFKVNLDERSATRKDRARMCLQLMRKHLVAINNALTDEAPDPECHRSTSNDCLWMRIVDTQNYLTLLAANLREPSTVEPTHE